MNAIVLKPEREKSVLHRHPWIFASSIGKLEGSPGKGETVRIGNTKGQVLGWGAYSPDSQIRVRVWSFDPAETIDVAFFRKKLLRAIDLRQTAAYDSRTNAYRLVHAESDGLPGLIVDQYGEVLVMQCLNAGIEFWRDLLADLLMEITGAACLYERSDADVRQLEGLPERNGLLRGHLPEGDLTIQENGLYFKIDIQKGHKTGFYLDQRANRARLLSLVKGRSVLNCFAYTGGFAIYALAGGATSVVSIDTSADALALAKENLALNRLPAEKAEWMEGDVFQVLRQMRDQARSFDLIVLDPPKFAPTIAQAERAARGYKDINLLGLKLLSPGGLLFTFSCSGGISPDLFQKIVAGAALDAGVNARIIGTMTQGPDHPIALNFPEGAYLKGLILSI